LPEEEIVTNSHEKENDEFAIQFITLTEKKSERERIEKIIKNGRLENSIEMILEKMLRFLAEMPVNNYHDYRCFRHKGLRAYLIHQFLTEKRRKL
jgi:hypothetical protein